MSDRRITVLPTAVTTPEQLPRAELRRFLEVWLAARRARGGQLPARADLTPEDLRDCMGNLIALEVIDGGQAFRYRLYGVNVCYGHGGDMTGKLTADLPKPMAARMTTLYRRILHERLPLFSSLEAAPTVPVLHWDRLIVPLAADGETVDIIMAAMYPVAFRRMPPRIF